MSYIGFPKLMTMRRVANMENVKQDNAPEKSTVAQCCDLKKEPVPFRIVQRKDIGAEMAEELKEAAKLVPVSLSELRILMNAVNWDKEKLLEWTSNGKSFLHLRDIGIIIKPLDDKQTDNSSMLYDADAMGNQSKKCLICHKSFSEELKRFSTSCEHWFCYSCMEKHLTANINFGERSQFQCPLWICSMTLMDIERIMKRLSPRLQTRYKNLCERDFVNCSNNRRRCPNDKICRMSCHVSDDISTKSREIQCPCGTNYCFACGIQWHYPLTCEQFSKWTDVFEKIPDLKTMESFMANTKPCPSCLTTLRKGVDDRVACLICGYEFCWHCLQKSPEPKICTCSIEFEGNILPEVMALATIRKDYIELRRQFPSPVSKGISLPLDEIAKLQKDCVKEANVIKTNHKTVSCEVTTIIRESEHLLGHCFAFAYFLENNSKKLEFLDRLYELESSLEVFTLNIARVKLLPRLKAKVTTGRKELSQVLSLGVDQDFWKFKSLKIGAQF